MNSNFVIVNNIVTAMSNKMMQQLIADYFKTQPIQKAWLFGSFARGEETPLSDVDLLVQYDDEGISLLKHAAMICELEEILDRPVDIVEDGTLLPFAVESANRDKKLIYERKS
ncbi:MAG: nucleotidyltransferase domain-containing protein [Bacteroidales bacterium]|nr:nucleotidyltransferase domain-containing protein [Bacteroidales bacterium]